MSGGLVDALLAVHEILTAAGIRHALCGGLAANLYRDEVRATSDVDIAVILGPARVPELVELLARSGWRAEPYWKRGEQLRLSHGDLPRVDCIIATSDYERRAIERSATAGIEGREVSVLAPEDLIVFKLIAGRARDYEAVAAIINSQGRRLDAAYISGWLDQFGFADRWQRAVEDTGREADGR